MKLAACLHPRFCLFAPQHAVRLFKLNATRQNIGRRSFQSTSRAEADYKWGLDILDEMRSGSRAARRKLPKTWASTHGSTSRDDVSSTTSARTTAWGRSKSNTVPWKVQAKRDKEAKLQDLERGLEVYTHKSPAGPPLVSGSPFLNALCKPSASSHTLDQPLLPDGTTSRNGAPRLKMPMLAYTADYEEANDLLSCLGPGPMGLDLEWNFSRLGPHCTALLQICSPSLILIVHTSAMSHRIPPLLKTILQDPNIIKTGVAIKNDALKLQRDYAIDTRNVVELSNLAKLAQPERWAGINHLISLRDLTRIYLGRRLRKDSVRVSDWEKYPLDAEQIEYAASDTFASLEVLRAVAEYFKASAKDVGGDRGLLDQLDRMDRDRANPVIDLDQALKLSAYDLYQERIGVELTEKRKQEQIWRTALREIQPNAHAPAPAAAQTKPQPAKAAHTVDTASSVKHQSGDDDNDFITVTNVLLAHDRAMNKWLYSRQSLEHIAISSKIKITTVANYILKALLEAKDKPQQSSLLNDFASADRLRLAEELRQAGSQCYLSLKRYRALARRLDWLDVTGHASGSEKEDDTETGSTSSGNRQAVAKKADGKAETGKLGLQAKVVATKRRAEVDKWSRPPLVVEISDSDEVDVEDSSR